MANPSASPSLSLGSSIPSPTDGAQNMPQAPQLALLDFFFPGFSVFAGAVQKYLHLDLNLYIPLVLLLGVSTLICNYLREFFWEQMEKHFMSKVDIRTDDEIYNILMGWVASQRFSQGARRFVVNTNLNSRSWYLWRWDYDEEGDGQTGEEKAKMALSYTPSFGSHYFWYRGRLLLFRRSSNKEQGLMAVSEREEISVSCFGRNPWILKELLLEARTIYMEKDRQKTLIYRGTTRSGSTEPQWQRCMARALRPFSTVILNEKTKKDLIEDVTDYIAPATQCWYSNRGIPYRRGYLLHGPPGTGKSSLSLALAGFFKMRIYIVSLSSITASEENLATLFAELPRRCVVLLEDIDTAGLTHTREGDKKAAAESTRPEVMEPGQLTPGNGNTIKDQQLQPAGRLSLSGLLNILDGVASQEGRILIMTTNHIDKLDKALIRPGRVDIIVEFGLADSDMTAAIFRAIFARLEGDNGARSIEDTILDPKAKQAFLDEKETERMADEARVDALAKEFAAQIPAHEFSPAELQGHLMRYKRDPRMAIDQASPFVGQTRKDKKEKELKDAADKRKAEEKKTEDEEKENKAEQEAKTTKSKKDKKEAKKRKELKEKPAESSDESSDEASSSESKSGDVKTPESASMTDSTKETLEFRTKAEHMRKDSGYGTPVSVEA